MRKFFETDNYDNEKPTTFVCFRLSSSYRYGNNNTIYTQEKKTVYIYHAFAMLVSRLKCARCSRINKYKMWGNKKYICIYYFIHTLWNNAFLEQYNYVHTNEK